MLAAVRLGPLDGEGRPIPLCIPGMSGVKTSAKRRLPPFMACMGVAPAGGCGHCEGVSVWMPPGDEAEPQVMLWLLCIGLDAPPWYLRAAGRSVLRTGGDKAA